MAIYGESCSIIIEQSLENEGLSKEDLSNLDKVKSVINKKNGPIGKILFALQIIGIVIIAIPASILIGIIIPIVLIIGGLYTGLDTVRKEIVYKSSIKKYSSIVKNLRSKYEKEKDPKTKQELKKSLYEAEKFLKKLEEDHKNADFEKEHGNSISIIKSVISNREKMLLNQECTDNDLYVAFNYLNISPQEFDKLIKSNMKMDHIEYIFEDGEDYFGENEIQSVYNLFKDKKAYIICDYGEYIILYRDGKFVSILEDSIKIHSFSDIVSGSNLSESDIKNLKETDIYFGYFKLSKPKEGDIVNPLPNSK